MSSSYTKSLIIDCPRSQSDEAISFNNENPSAWTNRVGDGVHIKAGDQISVHSTYVSEIGAETGEIDIKGIDLGITQQVQSIKTIGSLSNSTIPQKVNVETCSYEINTVPIRDDTVNITVSPYKTANGEHYSFLPRLYNASGEFPWFIDTAVYGLFDQSDGTTQATPTGSTFHPVNSLNICATDRVKTFAPYGKSASAINSKISLKNDNSRYTIFKADKIFFQEPSTTIVKIIGQATNGSNVIKILGVGSEAAVPLTGMSLTAQTPDAAFSISDQILSVSDSEIIMAATAVASSVTHNEFTFQFNSAYNAANLPSIVDGGAVALARRDPATFLNYIQVKDLLTLKANVGYNSPEDVATQLTEELNSRTDFQTLSYKFISNDGDIEDLPITFKTETPCYKWYNCATATNFEKSKYDEWIKVTGAGPTINPAYEYLSSYQHIGIKRPELYNQGKLLNASIGNNTEYLHANKNGDTVFSSGMDWTESNLIKIKEFFDTQKQYPEMFEDYVQTGTTINADKARFIHMNLFDNTNNDGLVGVPTNFGTNIRDLNCPAFGYDLYTSTVSASQTSFPLFVDFNNDTSEFVGKDVSFTDFGEAQFSTTMTPDFSDLAYGFARKIRIKTFANEYKYRIGFQFTRNGGKIPVHFFHANASNANQYELGSGIGRYWGFDYHFTAYGNAAMILYNGNQSINGQDYNNISRKNLVSMEAQSDAVHNLDKYQFGLYLGADAATIGYDEQQQRFQIQDFHSAEIEGDLSNNNSTDPAQPSNPNSDLSCYKINKRMLGNNYTPEMLPYTQKITGTMYAANKSNTVVYANPNIKSGAIFDARSGIFIEDWIVPEKFWDRSLIGIMGFRYEQFHNPNSNNSRQVRIRSHGANSDLENINIITTNARVAEEDTIDYSKNIFAGGTYQPVNIVPEAVLWNSSDPNYTWNRPKRMLPAVIISPAESVKITAKRLPSKTLRPYYTVRSDIVLENKFIGGGTSGITLPIVNVTPKNSAYGDFLNGTGGNIIFTNTIDRVLTRIKCSIHEPDGTAARCDLNSAVIFKIDKQIDYNPNIVGDLLASKKKQDQETINEINGPENLPKDFKFT